MKNKLIISAFLLLATIARSQVTVTAVAPGPRFTLDDLWQVTLVKNNLSINEQWLNVSLTVYDDHASKLVTSTTKQFQFKKTVININKANLSSYGPIDVNYAQRSFKTELAKQGGIFPSGNYKVEISCNLGDGQFSEPLGKYVYNINAELVMPIKLISVYNNDTIAEENPMFSWVPPYPLPAGNVTYEFILTEIEPNETPQVAIGRNQPLLKTNLINQNSIFYTGDAPKLQIGNEYAWQVNAYYGGKLLSGSETWRFVYDEKMDNYEPEQYYVMQEKVPNNCVYITNNLLPITFVEDHTVVDSIMQMNIKDRTGAVIATEREIPIKYAPGSNYTFISFCPDIFPLENGRYVLEIILSNSKKYYIRFINNSAPGTCAY